MVQVVVVVVVGVADTGAWAWALEHGVHCRCAVLQSVAAGDTAGAAAAQRPYRPKEERFLRARGNLGECWCSWRGQWKHCL